MPHRQPPIFACIAVDVFPHLLHCERTQEYTKAIDVWSVGCIFAELLGRRPLFPGKDYIHQLNLITDVIGTPDEARASLFIPTASVLHVAKLPFCTPQEDIDCIESEKARRYISSLPVKPPIPPNRIFPNANPEAIKLLQQMLVYAQTCCYLFFLFSLISASFACRRILGTPPWYSSESCTFIRPVPMSTACARFHPGKRITVEQALRHPYLASLHDPSDEPLAHAEFSFDFERMPLTKDVLRQLLTTEMLAFHPDVASGVTCALHDDAGGAISTSGGEIFTPMEEG